MTSEQLRINNHGQALGRKGLDTRRRLMDSAVKRLREDASQPLTPTLIARAAKTSSATFYLYFKDVKDLFYALSEAAEADMTSVHEILDEPWNPQRVETEHAARVVRAYAAVWDQHRAVLRYRNLEADRGDARFEAIRLRTSLRIVKRFGDIILRAQPAGEPYSKRQAMAEASVLVSAMERCAAVDPTQMELGVGYKAMWDAMASVVARILTGPGETPAPAAGRKSPSGTRAGRGKA